MAIRKKGKFKKGAIFHSDLGSQYTSNKVEEYIKELNLEHSYSKKGYPYDNASMESFNAILKKEEVNLHVYNTFTEAKKAIFKFQSEDGKVVLNYDNKATKECSKEVAGRVVFFSSKEKLEDGVIYDKGIIKECKDGVRKHIIDTNDIHLRGVHNYENVCAAIAATSELVDTETQVRALKNFKGVEHRLEFVRELDGVKWYNDSIGTSPSRTIAGLNSFKEKIVLIAGGYDKNLDYGPLAKPILKKATKLVLMGKTSQKIFDAVTTEIAKDPDVVFPIYRVNTLEDAVNRARQLAKPGEVVLFSPASASFDMFRNFAERGKEFKRFVNELK